MSGKSARITKAGHKWLHSRVAWYFGSTAYSGTCVGWGFDGGELLWNVLYDDGDSEQYTMQHLREGLRLHRELSGVSDSKKVHSRSSGRRAVSDMQTRPPRRDPDPTQAAAFFPVTVSLACLTERLASPTANGHAPNQCIDLWQCGQNDALPVPSSQSGDHLDKKILKRSNRKRPNHCDLAWAGQIEQPPSRIARCNNRPIQRGACRAHRVGTKADGAPCLLSWKYADLIAATDRDKLQKTYHGKLIKEATRSALARLNAKTRAGDAQESSI